MFIVIIIIIIRNFSVDACFALPCDIICHIVMQGRMPSSEEDTPGRHQHRDLGISSFQNYRGYISVVCNSWVFCDVNRKQTRAGLLVRSMSHIQVSLT